MGVEKGDESLKSRNDNLIREMGAHIRKMGPLRPELSLPGPRMGPVWATICLSADQDLSHSHDDVFLNPET